MSLTVEVAGKTDVGCVRKNNEDNFGYDSRCGIYVVCDGMGGQAAGEVASKMGVDVILTYFREAKKNGSYPTVGPPMDGVSERANALGSAIHLANEAIYEAATRHQTQSGMGSTVVGVLVGAGFFSIGHAGDSRIYLIREGAIQQLTRDHSLVMEQVRRGLLTMEEALHSEMQNIIIRALGPEEKVQPDLDDMMAQPGDVLLLCSDGLIRHVPDDSILEVVQGTISLQLMADRLIDAARDGGGSDNITVLLLRFEELPWYKKFFRWLFGGGSPKWQNSI
ncbi:MAG: Stp1/IreP family PP2C-type Ser/Thr phosphatase [Acidobacteriia bacterium]|nr:Stp1/IreP family PP2C-type Ser/Thr phosphatase [Terriglobia bacterium]